MAGTPGTAQGDGLRAYTGAAPQPARSISIAGGEARVDNPLTITDRAELTSVGPPDLSAPPAFPRGMRASEPPANPEFAQQLAEMNAKIGQLTDAVGKTKQDYEARLEEQALNHQIQLLAMQGRRAPALPDGLNPKQPVLIEDLNQILVNYGNDMQTNLLRQNWGVTPEEELAVLNSNPAYAQLPEPEKTIFIKKAVELRRRTSANVPGAPAPATSSSTPAPGPAAASAPQNSRPVAGHIVPMTEMNSPSDVGDVSPATAHQQALQEYRDADKIQNRAQRLAAKKLAMKKAQYALGISDEQAAQMSFQQRG